MITPVNNFDRSKMNADQKAIWLSTYSAVFGVSCLGAGGEDAGYAAKCADRAVQFAPLDDLPPNDEDAPIVRGPCSGRD